MAFFEDPRMRQRWNQISQTTETVTENAAAGLWSFGHTYVNPCLASITSTFDSCTTVCLGDREDRSRRARERQRARGRAEYSFDFYDDWDDELGGQDGGPLGGGWRSEDWDRLLAGTGKRKGAGGEVDEQPRTRSRGMSYGTRGSRRKASGDEDPTIIPSTAPIGFLGRLPFKIGGTLRYKPSAANLQEHPGASRQPLQGEREPLLGADDDDDDVAGERDVRSSFVPTHRRKRSGTMNSGATSDSFRSRGDLLPSDEEGEEDAVPLDDEFSFPLDNTDDRSSSRTKSSKGKRKADYRMPRSVSRTTMDSTGTSTRPRGSSVSLPESPALLSTPSLEDLEQEETRLEQEEDEVVEKKRNAATRLALRHGLSTDNLRMELVSEAKPEIIATEEVRMPEEAVLDEITNEDPAEDTTEAAPNQPPDHPTAANTSEPPVDDFIPAKLPHFR